MNNQVQRNKLGVEQMRREKKIEENGEDGQRTKREVRFIQGQHST